MDISKLYRTELKETVACTVHLSHCLNCFCFLCYMLQMSKAPPTCNINVDALGARTFKSKETRRWYLHPGL
jgi:hypothetical protein